MTEEARSFFSPPHYFSFSCCLSHIYINLRKNWILFYFLQQPKAAMLMTVPISVLLPLGIIVIFLGQLILLYVFMHPVVYSMLLQVSFKSLIPLIAANGAAHRWQRAGRGGREEMSSLNISMQVLVSLGRGWSVCAFQSRNLAWLHSGISAGVSMPCWTACRFDILHCSHFFTTVSPHGGWERDIIHL